MNHPKSDHNIIKYPINVDLFRFANLIVLGRCKSEDLHKTGIPLGKTLRVPVKKALALFTELSQDFNEAEWSPFVPAKIALKLISIRPFRDGNKRTAFFVVNYMLNLKSNIEWPPFSYDEDLTYSNVERHMSIIGNAHTNAAATVHVDKEKAEALLLDAYSRAMWKLAKKRAGVTNWQSDWDHSLRVDGVLYKTVVLNK